MSKTTHKSTKTAKKRRLRMLPILTLTALIVYLFVTAPSPLPDRRCATEWPALWPAALTMRMPIAVPVSACSMMQRWRSRRCAATA